MSRHIADKSRHGEGGRTMRFTEAERRQGPDGAHPAVKAKLREPRLVAGGTRRLKEFLRIERGQSA